MIPVVGKYYWLRLYRDDAVWQPAQRQQSDKSHGVDYCWRIIDSDEEWFDTEVNEIGPEIIPPPQ